MRWLLPSICGWTGLCRSPCRLAGNPTTSMPCGRESRLNWMKQNSSSSTVFGSASKDQGRANLPIRSAMHSALSLKASPSPELRGASRAISLGGWRPSAVASTIPGAGQPNRRSRRTSASLSWTLPEKCCAGCEAGGVSFAREGRQNSRHPPRSSSRPCRPCYQPEEWRQQRSSTTIFRARQRSGEWYVGQDAPLRPQHIRGRRRVLTLIAASGEEVRPVWIGEAVVALRQLSDLRRTVDARENALACLLDLPQ